MLHFIINITIKYNTDKMIKCYNNKIKLERGGSEAPNFNFREKKFKPIQYRSVEAVVATKSFGILHPTHHFQPLCCHRQNARLDKIYK